MNDHEPFDGYDDHLSERIERAVAGLRAPDVVARAIADGRRRRTHRRLAYGAGGFAAATALVLAVPAIGGWPEQGQDPSDPSVATDPTATSPSPTATASARTGADRCDASATGWWSKEPAQIEAALSALLPPGIRVGRSNDGGTGLWRGNLVAGGDADFASLTLLPPPGVPGPRRTLAEVSDGSCGSNRPSLPVTSCDRLLGHTSCQEVRDDDGLLVGVVAEKVEEDVAARDQPTGKTYLIATVAVPSGGHVELHVAEGTLADRPDTVHDPRDVPALTVDEAREIVTDPGWTD